MLQENEVIDCHVDALKKARSCCVGLDSQGDDPHAEVAAYHYTELKSALDRLEGSARQLAYYREDTRWLKLATVYTRLMPLVQGNFGAMNWRAFGAMVPALDIAMKNAQALVERKTGKRGIILPDAPPVWAALPDWNPGGSVS